jgi:LacI family transcriptional regulator
MRAARSHGLEPGPDIGVVGFDDTDVAEALQLTSVRQPLQQAAQAAWDLLLARGDASAEPVLLRPELTVRSTTTRPAHPRTTTPRTTTRARLTRGQRTDHTHMEGPQ